MLLHRRTHNTAVTQFTLPGFEAPQLALEHRLFFAVMPDPGTAARIAEMTAGLRSDEHVKTKPLHIERLHITLHHLGDFAHLPEVTVARACAAAASVDVPSFGVKFD